MSDSIDSDPFVHDQSSIGRIAQTVDEEHAALQACLNNFWAGSAIDTLVRLPNGWDMLPRASAVTSLRRGRRPTSSRSVAIVVVRGTRRGGATSSTSRRGATTTRSPVSTKKASTPARKAAPKKKAKSGKRGPKLASRPKRG